MGGPAQSPYAYCSNNPMNFVDPTGMQAACPYPAGWNNLFGDRYSAYDSWKYMQSVRDIPDDNGGQLSPYGGWTDASGADVAIAMNPWATSPERMYLQSNLDYAASHPNEAAHIAEQLASEGFTVNITIATYTNGELNGISQQTFTNLISGSLTAGPGGDCHSVNDERIDIFEKTALFIATNIIAHPPTGRVDRSLVWFAAYGLSGGDLNKTGIWSCAQWAGALEGYLSQQGYANYTFETRAFGPAHAYVMAVGKNGSSIYLDPWFLANLLRSSPLP